MPKFRVAVGGANYQVEAPDENTAWAWANQHHEAASVPPPKEESGIARRALADPLVGLAQGVIGFPESLVGLANIPTMGYAGKAAESLGFRPREAKEFLQQFKSPEQQEAERQVSQAEGFVGTLKKAAEYPSAVSNVVMESAPSMLGGAALARGIVGKAATGAVGAAGPQIPQAATGLSPLVAGAIGEGAISAGQTAESTRQQMESGLLTPEQSAVSAISGALTGGFGVLGGKVASKYLNVADIDTLLAGGVDDAVKGSILTAAFKGALTESVFEELPQSMQEQVAQNINTGRPWDEGVAEAGAMGMLAALPLGGGAAGVTQARYNTILEAEKQRRGLETTDEAEQAQLQQEAARDILGRELEVPDADLGTDTTGDGAGAEVPSGPAGGDAAGVVSPDGATVGGAGVDTGPVGGGAPAGGVALGERVLTPEAQQRLEREQEQLRKRQEYEAAAPERQAELDRLEQERIERLYAAKTPLYKEEDVGVDTVIAYETAKPERMAAWDKLTQDERSLFTLMYKQGDLSKAVKAVADLRQGGKAQKSAYFYEANRQAASKEYGLELPRWNELPESAKEVFSKAVPYSRTGRHTGAALHNAFGQVTNQLEVEGLGIRGATQEEITNAELYGTEQEALARAQEEIAAEQRAKQEAVGKGVPLSENTMAAITTGTLNDVLDTLSTEARGVAIEPMAATGKQGVGASVIQMAKDYRNVTSEIFKQLSRTLGSLEFNTKIVTDPANPVMQRLQQEGKLAEYDPKTDTMYITQKGMDESTILHETVHAGTVKIISKYLADPQSVTAEQREAVEHLQKIMEFAQKRLGNKYRNAFENLYEFVGYAMTDMNFQYELSNIQARPLSKYTLTDPELGPLSKTLWGQFTQAIAKIYGILRAGVTKLELFPELYETLSKEFFGKQEGLFTEVAVEDLNPEEEARFIEAVERLKANTETAAEADLLNAVFEDLNKTGELSKEGVSDLKTLNKLISSRLKKQKAAKQAEEKERKTTFRQSKKLLAVKKGYEGNALLEAVEAFSKVLAAPEAGIDVAPLAAKQAGTPPQKSVEQHQDRAENNVPPPPKSLLQREISWLATQKARLWAFREFQNERYPVKFWQDQVKKAGKLIIGEDGFNNIYDFITLAFGRAQKFSNEYIMKPAAALDSALTAYVEATGKTTRRALAEIGLYAEALHEGERRHIKFLKTVPLSDIKTILNPLTGKQEPASVVRKAIFDEIEQDRDFTDAEIAAMRQTLETLADKNNGYLTQGGASFDGTIGSKLPLDESADAYRVSHLTHKDAELIRQHYQKSPSRAIIDDVLAALKPMSEATIELNRKAGYWTKQVDNVRRFYGFQNYVPFKGKPNANVPNEELTSRLDPNTIALSTELKQTVGGFEGRTTESQNPILQMLADATSAAARAGRGMDYTQAIKNAIEQELIKGDAKVAKITFAERRRLSDEYQQLINQRNIILHYNKDGSIDVLKITDKDLLESIRRPYKTEANFLTTELNKWTSFFGQMHTRYNPSFPLIGFTRDILTNAFIMMAEGNPKMAAQFAGAAAKDVVKLGKANKVMRMYHAGNMAELRQYAADQAANGDSFANDMVEYLEQGGRISYAQSLSVRSAITELHQQVGRNGILKTKDQIEKVFDIWTDMFEITARTAAYALMRDNMVAKGMKPDAAKLAAASHVKQFANFEEVGRLGKELGAMFMFFRPSATGAVRSIEAILPGIQSWDSVKRQLPEDIFGTEAERTLSNVPKSARTPEVLARAAELNARVDNYKKQFDEQQAQARATIMALTAAGAAIWAMAAMMSGDDDDGRNKVLTDDMARWTRFARFDLGGDQVLQIPWGFGLGAFPAIGAQVASMFNSYSSSPMEFVGNFTNIFLDSFLPLPVSRMNPTDNFTAWFMDSITPSAIRPLYEYTMNVNSFGQEIYNNRQSRVSDAYIGGDNIPELYKAAAKQLFDATDGAVSWSPNTVYFLANNYMDGVMRMAHNGYGMALTMSGEKDFDPKRDIPLVESFLSKKSNIDNRYYAKVEKEVADYRQRLTTMMERNPDKYIEFIERNPHVPAMVELFDQITGSTLNSLREQANDIRYKTPDMSIKERNELLEQNKIAQSMVKRNIVDNIEYLKEMYAD